jgi:cysteine desulfuration protein SufE
MLIETSSQRAEEIKLDFKSCKTAQEIYAKLILWGPKLGPFDPLQRQDENRVSGCQSIMYFYSTFEKGRLYFAADSDALISKGLAALLIHLYSGETPEAILKNPPILFEELGIIGSLTPGRANGLSSLYLRMKQEAIRGLSAKLQEPELS